MTQRGLGDRAESELYRIRFAGLEFDPGHALHEACLGRAGWFEFSPLESLDWAARTKLDDLAPERETK